VGISSEPERGKILSSACNRYNALNAFSLGTAAATWFMGEPVADSATPPVLEGPPDLRRIVALAMKYGIEISPSPEGGRRKETRRKGGDHR